MARTMHKDDLAANILIEYLLTLAISMALFVILLLIMHNTTDNADRIVMKEECDIIANDIANRISTFSSEVNITDQNGSNSITDIPSQVTYVDLPTLVQGKQYKVAITYDGVAKSGKVLVSYASNSNIYSIATFSSTKTIKEGSFYSTTGRYGLYYDGTTNKVEMRSYT